MSKLLQEAKNAYQAISNIDWLNGGGCLYAAYGVYKVLERKGLHKNPNVVIVQFASWDASDIETNKKFIKGEEYNAASSTHFGFSVDGGKTFFDSNGEVDEFRYSYHLVIPNESIDRFCVSALKNGQWSTFFNKERDVPMIATLLDIDLDIYEKEDNF